MSKRRLRRIVEAIDVPWYILTVVLYAVALAATFLRSPKVSNEMLGYLLLFGGFTASVGTMFTAIKSQKPEEERRSDSESSRGDMIES